MQALFIGITFVGLYRWQAVSTIQGSGTGLDATQQNPQEV